MDAYKLAQKHVELIFSDIEAWGEIVDDDVVWEFPCMKHTGAPTEAQGRDVLKMFLKTTPYKNVYTEQKKFHKVDGGDKAFVECKVFGEGTTGGKLEQVLCACIEAKDGKIVRIREYFDPLAIGACLKVDMNIGGLLEAVGAARKKSE